MAELPAIKRRLIESGVDLIDVGAGDADFPPPDVAVKALTRAVQDPTMSRYAFQLGLAAFRDAAAGYMQRRFGVSVDPYKELHPLLGSKEGIAHLATAVLNPGDVAIVPVPGYAVYHGGTVLADAEPYLYNLTPRTDFLLELDELPRDLLKKAKLVYLNYPNNPTAAVAPRDYLERTIAACRNQVGGVPETGARGCRRRDAAGQRVRRRRGGILPHRLDRPDSQTHRSDGAARKGARHCLIVR